MKLIAIATSARAGEGDLLRAELADMVDQRTTLSELGESVGQIARYGEDTAGADDMDDFGFGQEVDGTVDEMRIGGGTQAVDRYGCGVGEAGQERPGQGAAGVVGAQAGNALAIIRKAFLQPGPEDLLQVRKAAKIQCLGELHQGRRLNAGAVGDDCRGAESDLVGMFGGEAGDLPQSFGKLLEPSCEMLRREIVEVLRTFLRHFAPNPLASHEADFRQRISVKDAEIHAPLR